jgi:two-component system OmpR family response regulator
MGRGDPRASMTKQRILIVADDAELRATLARWLMAAGYAVELAENLKRAREVVESTGIALSLVAPDQLGGAGAEPARELGGLVDHVIVIEAPSDAAGARTGPPIAADRYISRPVSEPEVLAKVRSALGPAPIREAQARPQLLQFEGYTLDAGGRTCVDAKGQEVTLTRAEFSLLLAFGQHAGRVLSRDELTHVVAGRGAEPDDRSVDVLISRLRRKIEPDPKTPRIIVTVPGEGYKFTAKPRVVVATDPASRSPAVAAVPEAKEALAQGAATGDRNTHAQEAPGSLFRLIGSFRRRAPQAALAVVLVMAVLGWEAWSNRAALRRPSEVTAPTISPAEGRRATVFKRMVATMQDDRFDWRTVERLAIESGIDETEAHEILAEHPGEVMLGKSREGKLIARLSER